MKRTNPFSALALVATVVSAAATGASPAAAAPFDGAGHRFDRPGARPGIVKVDHRHRSYPRIVAVPTHRRYRDVYVIRRHGHRYRGSGHHHHDADAYSWLAFTAISVKLLDMISESQQRAHESAQIRATTAPVGETIYWTEDNARGAVTAVRDGRSSLGRYCREFQQTLTVGGKTENAYGTACRQPDGSWEIIP